MKELLYNFKESMQKGIVLWVLAHLVLYAIEMHTENLELYNAQITKLYNPVNFLIQIVYAGLLFTALEVTLKFFVDNIFKYSIKGNKRKVFTNALVAIVIMTLVCLSAVYMKKTDIVNKNIVKVIFIYYFIIVLYKVISTVVNNTVYNEKLEKINKE